MIKQQIMYNALVDLAEQGNEQAKIVVKMVNQLEEPTDQTQVKTLLQAAHAELQRAIDNVVSGFESSAVTNINIAQTRVISAIAGLS